MSALAAQLDASLAALDMALEPRQTRALLDYLALLGKWNKTYNLTAIHEPERMLTHHLIDSLAITPFVGAGPLLDVGSGAGLPGVPLAIARPGLAVTLLDASQKKCGFMQQAAIELGLKSVRVAHGRVESLSAAALGAPDGFAQIVSRAFSELRALVDLSGHLLARGGEWLAMKGAYPQEELTQLLAQPCGVALKRAESLHVPGLDAARHMIVLEKA